VAALSLGRGALRSVRRVLQQLEAEGRVERVRGRYRRTRSDGLVEGVFDPSPRGGTLTDDAGTAWRVADAGDARAGDRVAATTFGSPERGRAEVLQIVEGRRDFWVGLLHRRGGLTFVTPYRDDGEWTVRVARSDTGDARDGEVVAVVPVKPRAGGRAKRGRREPATVWGRVRQRLGRPGDPDADVAAVAWRRRLPVDFPPEALAQADALPAVPEAREIERRVDLRERDFFTIDPASARDHDDAVCVEALPTGGWQLWVAIADVAHYVAPDTPIDAEALRRGNSVYFIDRALPMLPERLASGLCSLRPGEDRLVMVAELAVEPSGRVGRRSLYPGVIRSRARLAYEDVAAFVEGKGTDHPQAAALRELGRATATLARRRRAEGSIDFELPEAEIRPGPDGRALDIQRAARTRAHRAIEEAMLAANRAVAELLVEADVPAVHRVHEPPAAPDAESLEGLLRGLGLLESPLRGELSSRDVARALQRAAGRPIERFVHLAALRAMRQARYAAESRGHFALAFRDYLHFTSPIRRYADLVVHRVVKTLLSGEDVHLTRGHAMRIAVRVSFRERQALEAEREVADLARCAFMTRYVGDEVPGTITGVAPHGLYVTLDPWFVEGLVHVSTLPEFVVPDDLGAALVAERSGRRYSLGDRLLVRVAKVDQIRARIDFEILRVLEQVELPTATAPLD
jgi:ribonuclease R